MKMQEKKQIEVSDLGLATLLVTLHFNLVGLARANEKRINFLFTQADGIAEVISGYWTDVEISVPVQTLFNNQKLLKNRIYAIK